VSERDHSSRSGLAHGQLCYLQIPAVDPDASAAFYERVFGWEVERPYPSFSSPGLIGQWVTDRRAAVDAGTLLWINVDDVDEALAATRVAGGEVLEPPTADGPDRLLATIRDPAGNSVGIVQHGN
jgi:uncharacterized protein